MPRLRSDFATQAVLARLGWGHDKARSLSEIAEQMKAPRRAVELAIHALRLEGFPVASDGSGVWLGSAEDLTRCIDSLQRRVVAQHTTLKALRRARDRMLPVTQLSWLEVA